MNTKYYPRSNLGYSLRNSSNSLWIIVNPNALTQLLTKTARRWQDKWKMCTLTCTTITIRRAKSGGGWNENSIWPSWTRGSAPSPQNWPKWQVVCHLNAVWSVLIKGRSDGSTTQNRKLNLRSRNRREDNGFHLNLRSRNRKKVIWTQNSRWRACQGPTRTLNAFWRPSKLTFRGNKYSCCRVKEKQ